MPSLTLIEAQERARLIDVESYAIDFDLTGADDFSSNTRIRFSCAEPGAATFVELRARTVTRIVLNGAELDVSSWVDGRIPLPDLARANELLVEARIEYSPTAEGIHRFVDPEDGAVYVGAYGGTDVSQRVFACFDQPDLKAVFEVSATVPAGWTVLSNARRSSAAGGDAETRWIFDPTPRVSTYLVVLVAGPLHTVRSERPGMDFALHCRASLARHLDANSGEIFAITHACFDSYERLFHEPYVFDSYDQVFVPGSNWGAMETPGCVTFREEFIYQSAASRAERQFRAVVIAHEMAHMWFGNLVTMRWWDDLWLSEAFAEYMGFEVASRVTEYTESWIGFAVERKTWAYDADQRPSTHPVAPPAADVADVEIALANFDGISYAKGASSLRQLAAWLGESSFLKGVNDFLTRYRLGSADHDDLFAALARASRRDVVGWAQAWLHTSGVDVLTGVRQPDGGYSLTRRGQRPHRLSVGCYTSDGRGGLTLTDRVEVELAENDSEISLPAGVGSADVVIVNDDDLAYCKLRPDPQSWERLTTALGSIDDARTRAVVWTTARDLVRDGELHPDRYLDLVASQLLDERDAAVLEGALNFARYQVVDRYLEPHHRAAALARLFATCTAIRGRTDQPDLGLTTLRVSIDCVSLEDAGMLTELLTTGQAADGRTLDADLRWRVLTRACVLGAAGDGEIDDELRRDPSASGVEAATTCRAAQPTAAAKQAAWAQLFPAGGDGPELTLRSIAAIARGFWKPEHLDVLEQFVPRYVRASVELADRRGSQLAKTLASSDAFPWLEIDRLIPAMRDGLDVLAPAQPLYRPFGDRLDDLERIARARAAN